jgi:hypothetical protein
MRSPHFLPPLETEAGQTQNRPGVISGAALLDWNFPA